MVSSRQALLFAIVLLEANEASSFVHPYKTSNMASVALSMVSQQAAIPPPTQNGRKTVPIPPQPNGDLTRATGQRGEQRPVQFSGDGTLIGGQYRLGGNPQTSSGKSAIYKAIPHDAESGDPIPDQDAVIVKLSSNTEALEREARNYAHIVTKGDVKDQGLFVEVHDYLQQADPNCDELKNQAAIIMEKGDKDLRTYIQKHGPLKGQQLQDTALSAARCVKAIHDSDMVWTELKSDNFVVTNNHKQNGTPTKGPFTSMDVKGIDLESAVPESGNPIDFTPYCIPPEFALEFLCGREPNMEMEPSFDMWSLGILFYKMATGKNYFNPDVKDATMIAMALKDASVLQNGQGSLDLYKHEEMKDVQNENMEHLISWCLEFDPKARPTIDEVLQHPFFTTPCI